MGIPGLFRHIIKRYNNSIINDIRNDKNRYLYFDYNGLIHNCKSQVSSINSDNKLNDHENNQDFIENQIIEKCIKYTENIIKYINPTLSFISIDGVPPLAKSIQQRKRRYKSAKENSNIDYNFDSNCISPGTNFMKKLNKSLEKMIKRWTKKNKKIILSSSDQPGEGEQKIFEQIKKSKDIDANHIIYGLDADLIMLSLICPNNLYLLREVKDFEKIFKYTNNIKTLFNYLDINILKENIINHISKIYKFDIKNIDNFFDDFVFIGFFLGNDFLPHFKCLDIYINGIDTLINYYMDLHKKKKYIVNKKSSINMDNFLLFLQKLSKDENNLVKKNSKYYENKNLDQNIYRNIENWRKNYYNYHYNTNCINYINKISKNYLNMLKWNFDYYFNSSPSCWHSYYKYDAAISIYHLYSYMKNTNIDLNNIKFEKNKSLTTDQLLMIILPPKSINLIKKKYHNFMTDMNSPLFYLFPIDFKYHTIDKLFEWMHEPILPCINLDDILENIY